MEKEVNVANAESQGLKEGVKGLKVKDGAALCVFI